MEPQTPVLTFLSDVGDVVRRDRSFSPESGHFGEIAALSLRRALMDALGEQGPSLFGAPVDQIREGLRRQSGADQFGRLARSFVGDFLARTLSAAVDRELSNHATMAGSLGDAAEARAFSAALDRYARESAVIVQQFAAEWYAKHRWQTRTEFTRRNAGAFVAVALRKIGDDLELAGARE